MRFTTVAYLFLQSIMVTVHTVEAQGEHKFRYIRFRKLLVGRGSTALDDHVAADPRGNINHMFSSWGQMCKPWPWREVRAVAYGNNDVKMTPAAQLKPLVLVADGTPDEKRPFTNGNELADALSKELSGVEVKREIVSKLTGLLLQQSLVRVHQHCTKWQQ